MRACLVFGLLLLSPLTLRAQEQEKKLLDRLLKPDMSLENSAQGKQFVAGGATLEKKAPTKEFYVAERKAERGFWNTRQISSKEFSTATAHDSKLQAQLNPRSKLERISAPYSTASYAGVREASDARKSIASSEFAGSRPFLDKGKSQKALSAHDQPLTIDQVRDLLNKNK